MRSLSRNIASVLFAAVASSIAHAAPIIQDTDTGNLQLHYYSPVGQSFTADDAWVNSVGFFYETMNAWYGNVPVTVTLYAGSGFDGGVLGSAIVAPPNGDFHGYVDAMFQNLTVTVGQTYTAGLSTDNAYWGARLNWEGDPYSGGRAFYQQYSDDALASGADFRFRVNAVPEPETYAMLLAGLGLLGVVARRRKAGPQ